MPPAAEVILTHKPARRRSADVSQKAAQGTVSDTTSACMSSRRVLADCSFSVSSTAFASSSRISGGLSNLCRQAAHCTLPFTDAPAKQMSQRGEARQATCCDLFQPRRCCKGVATEGSTQALQVLQEAHHKLQGGWCGLVRFTWYASRTISWTCSRDAACSRHCTL